MTAGRGRHITTAPHVFHLPVVNLQIPTSCQVGPVQFRPASDLEALVRRSAETSSPGWSELLNEVVRVPGRRWWATADVEAASIDEARSMAREGIALLRLFQKWRYRMVSL